MIGKKRYRKLNLKILVYNNNKNSTTNNNQKKYIFECLKRKWQFSFMWYTYMKCYKGWILRFDYQSTEYICYFSSSFMYDESSKISENIKLIFADKFHSTYIQNFLLYGIICFIKQAMFLFLYFTTYTTYKFYLFFIQKLSVKYFC